MAEAMKVKCYMCGKDVGLTSMEYQCVEIHNEIKSAYSCVVSDDEIVAYLCLKCHEKILNIKDEYL